MKSFRYVACLLKCCCDRLLTAPLSVCVCVCAWSTILGVLIGSWLHVPRGYMTTSLALMCEVFTRKPEWFCLSAPNMRVSVNTAGTPSCVCCVFVQRDSGAVYRCLTSLLVMYSCKSPLINHTRIQRILLNVLLAFQVKGSITTAF